VKVKAANEAALKKAARTNVMLSFMTCSENEGGL
jgi:hypothetical protein